MCIKLYVIKDKNLGYLTEDLFYTKHICYAMLFNDFELAKLYCDSSSFIVSFNCCDFHIHNIHNLCGVLGVSF